MLPALLLLDPPAGATEPLGEAWVEVREPSEFARLAGLRHVARAESTRQGPHGVLVRVLVAPGGLTELQSTGLRVIDYRAEQRLGSPPVGFHTPADGTAWLEELAGRSDRAGLALYGTSLEGRALEAMWIGEPPGSGAPSYRILAAHHGDEASSAEVALGLAERLVGVGDPVVDAILDRSTVWIVPYVNPDGVAAGTRVNARGVDLNRNYDYEWSADAVVPGAAPFSEPETRAVRAAAVFERPVASLTLHAGAVNIGWPWNYTTDPTPDAAALQGLGRQYAAACDQPGFWVTQGGDWYLSHGDTDDWAYGWFGGLDFTVEVSEVEAAEVLPDVVAWHVGAILAFLSTEPSIEGTVVDAVSGVPVEASLSVSGSHPFPTDPATGAFARILPPHDDPITLQVQAPGYESLEVQVLGDQPVRIELAPRSLTGDRVEPVALWEPVAPRFPGPAGPVRLEKPGAAPITVQPGQVLDPSALSPGAWTVVLADGGVVLRGLLVEDHLGARVDRWSDDGDTLTLDGVGFGEGARAWAFAGLERAPVEVPLTVVDSNEATVDDAALPSPGPVDLMVWTDGALLALADVRAGGSRDGWVDEDLIATGGCGCASRDGILSSRGAWALSILAAALSAWSRRRS